MRAQRTVCALAMRWINDDVRSAVPRTTSELGLFARQDASFAVTASGCLWYLSKCTISRVVPAATYKDLGSRSSSSDLWQGEAPQTRTCGECDRSAAVDAVSIVAPPALYLGWESDSFSRDLPLGARSFLGTPKPATAIDPAAKISASCSCAPWAR